MDHTNHNFKGQLKNEELISFCRKHWIVLTPHIMGLLAAVVLIPIYLIFVPGDSLQSFFSFSGYHTMAFVAVALLTYYMHYTFTNFLNYFLRILMVTNFRVIDLDKTVILHDS